MNVKPTKMRPATPSQTEIRKRAQLAVLAFIATVGMTGCATTTTIFFPKERAAKAADNVIDEIFGVPPAPSAATSKTGQAK